MQERFPLVGQPAADTPLYGLDIETDTTVNGLDPSCAAILAVAVVGDGVEVVVRGPEDELLAELDALLRRLAPGVLVTWNGARFDLPFIADRAASHGVALGLELWADDRGEPEGRPLPGHDGLRYRAAWYGHAHLDGYLLYRSDTGRGLGLSCALKNLARLVGLDPVQVDRERIHELSDDELVAYVASDAHLAREMVARRGPAALASIDRR